MKRLSILLLIMTLGVFNSIAQDIMTKSTGEYIDIKVLEITETEIKYKEFNNPNGPTYIIPRTEVVKIRYENGTIEQFQGNVQKPIYPEQSTNNSPTTAGSNNMQVDMYEEGEKDARKYYKKYKSSATGTFCATVGCGALGGLIPAISTSLSTPKPQNLGAPNNELLNNKDYKRGYSNEARRIKSRKVWNAFGIGLAVNVVATIIIYSMQ